MKFEALVDASALPAPIQEAFFHFIQAMWDHGQLDGQIREMIRMRSAILVDCKQ